MYIDFPEQSTSQIVKVGFFWIPDSWLKKSWMKLWLATMLMSQVYIVCSKSKSKYCQQLKLHVNKSFQRSEELQQDFLAQS